MSLSTTVDAMVLAGCSSEQIAAVVRAHEAEAEKRRLEDVRQWDETRAFVLARDNWTCVYCGSPGANQCDHVIPRSRGGRSVATNLVAACRSCNSSKKDRTPSEWLR